MFSTKVCLVAVLLAAWCCVEAVKSDPDLASVEDGLLQNKADLPLEQLIDRMINRGVRSPAKDDAKGKRKLRRQKQRQAGKKKRNPARRKNKQNPKRGNRRKQNPKTNRRKKKKTKNQRKSGSKKKITKKQRRQRARRKNKGENGKGGTKRRAKDKRKKGRKVKKSGKKTAKKSRKRPKNTKRLTKKERKQRRKEKKQKQRQKKIKERRQKQKGKQTKGGSGRQLTNEQYDQCITDFQRAGRIFGTLVRTVHRVGARIPKMTGVITGRRNRQNEFDNAKTRLVGAVRNGSAPICANATISAQVIRDTIATLDACPAGIAANCTEVPDQTAAVARAGACKDLASAFGTALTAVFDNNDTATRCTDVQTVLSSSELTSLTECRSLTTVDDSVRAIRDKCNPVFRTCRQTQVAVIDPVALCPENQASSSTPAGGNGTTAAPGGSNQLNPTTSAALMTYMGQIATRTAAALAALVTASGRKKRSTKRQTVPADCLTLFNNLTAVRDAYQASVNDSARNETLADETLTTLINQDDLFTTTEIPKNALASCGNLGNTSRQSVSITVITAFFVTGFGSDISTINVQATTAVKAQLSLSGLPQNIADSVNPSGTPSSTGSSSKRRRRMAIEQYLQENRFKDNYP